MPVEIEGRYYATVCSGTPDGKTSRGHRLQVKKLLGDSSEAVIKSPWITRELFNEEFPGIEIIQSDGICPDCWPKNEIASTHPDLEFYKLIGVPYKKG